MIADLLRAVLFLLAAAGCVYLLAAIFGVLRFAARRMAAPRAVPVTILKPLQGDEPGLFDRLAALARQDYDAPIEIVFGVRSADDPAVKTAEAFKAAFPAIKVEIAAGTRGGGSNPKVANLINMAPHISHPTIVVADSDIDVGPDYLGRLAGALAEPGIGAVTCLYYGDADAGFWPQLSALAVDSHFLPSVTVALWTGIAEPAFGSTIALRRQAFDAIGGFAPFADQLADDYAIGEAVRAAGWKVAIPPFLVAHACNERRLADLWRHELRWARTNRAVKPLGYAGSVVTHPLPLALLGWLLGSFSCLLLAGAALAGRLMLCVAVERSLRVPRHNYWLVPIRDVFSFAVFTWSFFGGRVSWRGESYELGPDGAIIEAEPRERR